MRFDINFFSDIDDFYFLDQILPDYNISYHKIIDINDKKNLSTDGIIYFDEDTNQIQNQTHINFNDIKNRLIVYNFTNYINYKNKKNLFFINSPTTVESFRSHVKKFFEKTSIKFKDIELHDTMLINLINNKSCLLTDIEKHIILTIIKNKNSTKTYIKKNILNIKNDLETHSLESHLSRIRKKFEKIDTSIKIQSKNDNLHIF